MLPKVTSSGMHPPTRQTWYLAALLLITALSYGATLRFGYVYDDVLQIENNPRIKSVDYFPSYFTHQVWEHAKGQPQNLYRPLFMIWLWLNFLMFGVSPAGWHATTLLLHLVVVWMVHRLARRLLPDDPMAALIAAAVFALHPIHVEAVAWISGVTEPLSTALFLAALLFYLKARPIDRAVPWISLSVGFYMASMFVKESAAVLPAIIVLYELCCGLPSPAKPEHASATALVRRVSPYFAVLALYLLARAAALHGLAHRISDVPVWSAVLTWPWLVYLYVSQLLAPVALGPFYDVKFVHGFEPLTLVLPILILAAVAAGLWMWSRRSHSILPVFLGGWFLVTLSPALASFVVMSRYENVHDRYTYLPSMGLAVLVASAWSALRQASRHTQGWRKEAVFAGMVLFALAALTYHQTLYWATDESLFARGCAVAPRNVLARLNFASEMVRQHRFEAAFDSAQRAVAIDPNSALALNSAAESAFFLGKYVLTEDYYHRALLLAPPRVDQLFYLGHTRIATRNYRGALDVLQQGQSLWPDSPGYHAAMGDVYLHLGDWELAQDEYKKELLLYPTSPGAARSLALVEQHLLPTAVSKTE
jgi:hypothetical protein